MFDLGITEMLVVAVIAVVVVGPRELPGLMRTVGRWVGQARAIARQMQTAIEEAADEADIKELSQPLQNSIMADPAPLPSADKQDADKQDPLT